MKHTPRSKSATMADVGKLAGVSPMTVSRAFKPNTSVSDYTREKIQKAADELGYILDFSASGLSSRKSGFVAVTIPSINNANFSDTVGALTERLSESGLQVLLGYTNYDIEAEERLIVQLLQRRPEAMVVTGGNHTDRCRKILENAEIPIFEMWDIPKKPIDHVVGFSNAQTSVLMLDHFVECGFKNIGYLGSDETRDTRGRDRYHGFIKGMKKYKLEANRAIFSPDIPVSMREGAAGVRKLLEQWPDTEAIMCVSDLAAFGAITECQRMGMEIPKDIAFGGFGAYDLSEFSIPSITTIDVSAKNIGDYIATNLLQLLDSNETQEQQRLIKKISAKLIIRSSTKSTSN